MKEPLVFFGNERLATGVSTQTPILKSLIADGYKICAVVSNYASGQSRNLRSLEIEQIAKANNIPLLLPNRLSDIKQELVEFRATAGILVAYGKIVPKSVIDIFPLGIINLHPSLLPKHRGPTPIESVILNGEDKTGVSIMALSEKMDSGPLYLQSSIKVGSNDTKQILADKLLELGKKEIVNSLPGILERRIEPKPQDELQATYDNLITKSDGIIDWHKSADLLDKQIRAHSGWPKSKASLANIDVIITKASVLEFAGIPGTIRPDKSQLIVYCGNNALKIEALKPDSKNEMSGHSFIAGYGSKLT